VQILHYLQIIQLLQKMQQLVKFMWLNYLIKTIENTMTDASSLVSKLWNYCNVLRDDGIYCENGGE